MMRYSIISVDKVKSEVEMRRRFMHNARLYSVLNADPTPLYGNQELVEQNGKSYNEIFHEYLASLHVMDVPEKKIRKNGVLAYEVILRYSKDMEPDINKDEWAKASLAWLQETFNPPSREIHYTSAETGKEMTGVIDNVKAVTLHNDEETPHLHAFIVPIDDRGHLNASYYTNGRSAMFHLHDSYAKAMEPFGLERGERGSAASREKVAKYYRKLLDTVEAELPSPKEGETIDEFRRRCQEIYQTALAHMRDQEVRMNQEIIRAGAGGTAAKEELYQLKKEIGKAVGKQGKDIDREDIRAASDAYQEKRRFIQAVQDYPDQDQARQCAADYDQMVAWQMQREEKLNKKEKKRGRQRFDE